MTGRQQFYLDHTWMLELGEQLPVHKGPVDVDAYPLRWITPHGRWSIHSTWRNAKFQLRLQRGRPVVYLSPAEAASRGLLDNDVVTVFNNHGSLDAHLYISPRMPDGMAMMYHGWEAYTVLGGQGWQSPVTIRIKPTQLIGRYGQMNFRLNYFGPTGNQKDTRVEVELKLREPDNSMAPWPA
jgi:complex iron-sulfur molybdoenzyme family reductase subunit alpha